jgi:flagellar motor switch protein FliN/FliY
VAAGLEAILSLEVPLIVRIAERTMPLDEVLAMAPGAIIELPKAADAELDILVNNKPIGTGIAVKVGENYGVRVSYIGDLGARIKAMGRPAPAAEEK